MKKCFVFSSLSPIAIKIFIIVLLYGGTMAILPAVKTASAQTEQPPISMIIDGDLDPHSPSNLHLASEGIENQKMGKITLEKRDGKLYVNGKEVVRYLSSRQKDGGSSQGNEIRNQLNGKKVLNACIMDALLEHRQFIPDEWKTGFTFFWGTIFHADDGSLNVECLKWDDSWYHYYISFGEAFHGDDLAAVLSN